jgi:hypothetical protein
MSQIDSPLLVDFIVILTYMSTQAQIIKLEAAGTLVRYMPRISRPPRRRLFLGPDAQKDLVDSASATNALVGRGYILAALDKWVLGEKVHGKKRGEFLDRLNPPPPDVWEIRVTVPAVQARLFGRFAAPDTLILTKFHTRSMLGNKGSQGWNKAMAHCDQSWNTLFPGIPCFTHKNNVREYVTENCDDYPI